MITLDASINILGLSTRPARALWCDNIETIGQLIELAPHELLRIPGLGRLSLNEIEMNLSLYGLALRDPKKDRPIFKTKGRWNLMETAPKDGTPVLASLGRFMYIVFWSDHPDLKHPHPWWEQGHAEWEDGKWIGYHENFYPASPTHWMPLPEGPK